ncbi:MAG TPA: cytoplasmic protein [Candidatus Binatia bacterium]|jgi:hypothetical protein|nr:cytoplasmic protein [Candidatus Binatia bacterium]
MAKQYEDFRASQLYCGRCRQAMPVRERLLLVLPDGDLYEYICEGCGGSVGSKTAREPVEGLIRSGGRS